VRRLLRDHPEVVLVEEAVFHGGAGLEGHAELAPLAEFGDGVAASDGAVVIGTIAIHCVGRSYMEVLSCQEVVEASR